MGQHVPSVPEMATALVVLLLLLEAPVFSSARVMEDMSSPSPPARRGLRETASKPGPVKISLMHAQHVDSPYRDANLTSMERAKDAVETSKHRLNNFARQVRRKTLGVQNDAYTSPVYTSKSYYVTPFEVGTPASTYHFFVDTGSDLTWLQCTPCTSCIDQPSAPFDPTQSSSYSELSCLDTTNLCQYLPSYSCSTTDVCLYSYTYGDQSYTQGDMAYETYTFEGTDGTATAFSNVAFGCGTNQEMAASGDFDGLVGLGGGPLSLVSQLGSYIDGVFSYCLVGYYASTTATSPLLLGSIGDSSYFYTPLVSIDLNPTFYYVNLLGIEVDGTPVSYPTGTFDIDPTTGGGGIILDSGTTLTMLFDDAYTALIYAVDALISYPVVDGSSIGLDLCYDASSASTPEFPTVTFAFEDVNLNLNAPNTFLEVDGQGSYCFFFSSAGDTTGVSIFGNVQQQNFGISIDIPNAQVGWAGQAC